MKNENDPLDNAFQLLHDEKVEYTLFRREDPIQSGLKLFGDLIESLEQNRALMLASIFLSAGGLCFSWYFLTLFPFDEWLTVLACLGIWLSTFVFVFCGGYFEFVRPQEKTEKRNEILSGFATLNQPSRQRYVLLAAAAAASINLIVSFILAQQ